MRNPSGLFYLTNDLGSGRGIDMGVLTRKQGTKYVISSDRILDEVGNKRAPRIQSDIYQVWTGVEWSTNRDDALSFDSLDDADEYVRANYGKVTGKN